MCGRKPSPKTIISILALILALALVSGCGSSSSSKSAGAAPTAESEQQGDEVVEQRERAVHMPAGTREDFVTSCVHHLRATRSLCVCFHERVEANKTHEEIAALEVDIRDNVPLPAALVGYVEECPK
jgi:hypothetical protein